MHAKVQTGYATIECEAPIAQEATIEIIEDNLPMQTMPELEYETAGLQEAEFEGLQILHASFNKIQASMYQLYYPGLQATSAGGFYQKFSQGLYSGCRKFFVTDQACQINVKMQALRLLTKEFSRSLSNVLAAVPEQEKVSTTYALLIFRNLGFQEMMRMETKRKFNDGRPAIAKRQVDAVIDIALKNLNNLYRDAILYLDHLPATGVKKLTPECRKKTNVSVSKINPQLLWGSNPHGKSKAVEIEMLTMSTK